MPNSAHSIFLWQDAGKLYAVIVDNTELHDVDIFDVTTPAAPKFIGDFDLVALADEQNFDLVDSSALGNSIFHHDVVVKKIGAVQTMLVSYWDAGYVKLNVNDPTAPTFIGDSDFGTTDPLRPDVGLPEGNGHEAEFSHDNQFVLAADEDFAAFRPGSFQITTGPDAGEYESVGVGGAASAAFLPDRVMNGPTVYGGYGCDASKPIPPRATSGLRALEPGEEAIIVLQRGPVEDAENPEEACFPGEKAENGINAGYDAVLFVNHHVGEAERRVLRLGRLPAGSDRRRLHDARGAPQDLRGAQRHDGAGPAGPWPAARRPRRGRERRLAVRRVGLHAPVQEHRGQPRADRGLLDRRGLRTSGSRRASATSRSTSSPPIRT